MGIWWRLLGIPEGGASTVEAEGPGCGGRAGATVGLATREDTDGERLQRPWRPQDHLLCPSPALLTESTVSS